jgi:putative phosphoesterase
MRLGLIADIHGNKLALDAVLRQLDDARVDEVLCLGDVVVLGPDPAGVVRTLRERRIPVVKGNTDSWLHQARRPDPIFADLTRWTLEQLPDADRAFIDSFPQTVEMELAPGFTLLACHGSPRSWDEVLSALTPEPELTEALTRCNQPVITGGHTHIQLLRRFGQRHLVNPGSVGLPGIGPGTDDLPVNTGVTWAEYAILDATGPHAFSVTFRRIPIDLTALFAAAESSRMPHIEWWKALWGNPITG